MLGKRLIAVGALALMAILVTPAGVYAAEVFTAEKYPATVDGSELGTHVLSYEGRDITCASLKLSGTLTKAGSELSLTPTYSECHAEVLGSKLDATVQTTGCTYLLVANPMSATLTCEAGKDMVLRIYGGLGIAHTEGNELCVYTVKGQKVESEATDLAGPPKELVWTSNSALAATRVKGGVLTCGEAEGSAKYEGLTTLSATNGGGSVGLDRGEPAPEPTSLTAASYPLVVSAEQTAGKTHVFTYQGRPSTCGSLTFDPIGSYGAATNSIKVTPTYANCHAVILGNILPATITHNECVYNFTVGVSLTGNSLDLECPTGKKVQIHVYSAGAHTTEVCTYEIGSQTVEGVSYSNMGSGDITIATNSTFAASKTKGDFVTCGGVSASTTYVGEQTTLSGSKGEAPVNTDVG